MINPVIYAFTIDEFRENVKSVVRPFLKVLGCCSCLKTLNREESYRNLSQPLPRSGRAYSLTTANKTATVQKKKCTAQTHLIKKMRSRKAESNGLGMITEAQVQEEEETTFSAVEELVWSAKLYCILISPKSTDI